MDLAWTVHTVINETMRFAEDGEWWGQERWRMAKNAIEGADELLESALIRQAERLDAGPAPQNEREAEDLADAHYHLVWEPASVLRAGLFCQAASYFEYALLFLCAEATSEINGQELDRATVGGRDLVKKRIRFLAALSGADFLSAEIELGQLLAMRNLATHSAGETVALPEGQRETVEGNIERWVADHATLATFDAAGVRLNQGFVRHVTEYYERLFNRIVATISASARNAIARRSPPALPEMRGGRAGASENGATAL